MRTEHKAPVIGESLYLWAGNQIDLPADHDSLQKRELTSTVDVYQLSTADWSSHLTRGTPPLGVAGYSCTTSHSNIYYFGGWCGHDDCYHNTLNVLNTIKMQWTLCSNAEQLLMKKGYAGMVLLEFDAAEYLVIIGGYGSAPTVYHPQFQYDQLNDGRVHTNEQLLYNVSTKQFIVPSVSGQCCLPTDTFIIEKITTAGNRGIMFGGLVTVNDHETAVTNSVYIFSVTHNIINWEILKPGAIPSEGLWPVERCDHASAIINGDYTSPTLVVIGGRDNKNQLVNECLLFDSITTGQCSCRKIPLPESVTGRYSHSLTAVTMSPHCVWLVILGGFEKFEWEKVRGRVKPIVTFITDSNRLIMIIELIYSEAGEWIVQAVLDGNNLTSKNYQEKYQSYSKTRTWWMEQLIEYPTEKEMKLQRYIQSLHQELQVAHQSKVSLQEALVEANKQVKGNDSNDIMGSVLEEMRQEQEKLIEEKQIITEDYEKLKLKVADMEEKEEQYLKEKQIIIEKDKVIAKLTSQAEEQSQNEKHIITDLKKKELYIAKLVKERQERVLKQPIKETSSIGLQFNYLIPSMEKLDCLSDVQVAERKLFLIQGDKPQLMNWEKYGLRIGVQEASLSCTDTVEAAVVALVGGQFQFPPNTVLVSAVYAVSLSKPLLKRLILEIQHCVALTGRPALSRHLKFAIAPVSIPSLPYQFSIVEGGEFKPDSWYGSIQRKEFCLVAIVGEKHLPKLLTDGDESEEEEEEEQEEQAEEETEEEVEDGNSDSSSDSDKTKDPPGGSSGGQGESTSNEGLEEEEETGGQSLHEEGNEEQDNERVEESNDHEEPQHEEGTAPIPCTDSSSDFNSKVVVSTGIVENMAYAGLVYYEEKRAEDLVTFAAAKDLSALLEFIKKDCPHAERGQNILFRFKDYHGYIELKFDAPQKKSFTGWNIEPHMDSCKFLRCDVDKFGEATYPLPSICLISVYASPGAVPSLHYSVPLDGVADPKTLFIHRSLRTTPPPPSTVQGTSSSSSTASISQTRRETEEGTFRSDIAHRVMTEYTSLIKNCGIDIYFLVDKLLEHNIINAREKREITDGYTKHTASERIDELLHIISSSISMDGEVFGIFLDVLREEGTRRTIKLADKLIEKYKSI
uniref:CARD domain-containing protein n=1 Tax=Amphimedon queenslandica TaxID=400682 RepID=A0A1X7UV64_AMPQE